MTQTTRVSGEVLDHKLAAIFDTEDQAEKSAEAVVAATSLELGQVQVVRPGDTQAGWELEPEDKGIWRTLVRSHVWLALLGAVVGFCVFLVLFATGVGFVANNLVPSAAVLTALFTMFGLLAGGLVTIRPDHMPYIVKAQSALKAGKTVLAIHARDHKQVDEAKKELYRWHVKTVSSF